MVKPQGRRGEVAAEILTDFPERFAERKRVFALAPEGERRELQVDEAWPHKGRIVLKFSGIDSISQAETLVGYAIQIPLSQRVALEPGSHYVSDLVGCTVIISDAAAGAGGERELGAIADVQFGAGEAPLLVVREGKREYLIPFAYEYLKGIDLAGKRVRMSLPEGMLDLDAPLTPEEKQAQRKRGT